MAVRKMETEVTLNDKTREEIAQQIVKLLKKHSGEIKECIDDSETKKLNIAFGVEIDCSESEQMVTTKMRFTASVTDRSVFRIDDPRQGVFTQMTAAEVKRRDEILDEESSAKEDELDTEPAPEKKKRGKKAASEDIIEA